ncbi:MAG: chemotaxis protein CheD [Actinomycetota bacterium]|nr:chemotaxis protein CheD [Actinomycetota bacterium]
MKGTDSATVNYSDPNLVEVGVGMLAIAEYPKYLMTPALGSCVGVALYDATLRQGGLAHIMLPMPLDSGLVASEDRFASNAIPRLVSMLSEAGSPRRRLMAKLAGGAAMFRTDSALAQIGERNVAEVRRQLKLLNILVIAEDTGESHARTVELHLDNGTYVVRSYLYGVRKL